MIAYFWPFAIMKSLKQNNEVTEMYVHYKLNTTGQEVVLPKDRAPGFEFAEFELLDAPPHMPAGSTVHVDCTVLDDDGSVMPSVFGRGW